MAGLKKEGSVTEYELSAMGGDLAVKGTVSIMSEEYQGYIRALRRDAELTEKYGGRTIEGIEGIRAAASKVDKLALKKLLEDRSN